MLVFDDVLLVLLIDNVSKHDGVDGACASSVCFEGQTMTSSFAGRLHRMTMKAWVLTPRDEASKQ